MKKIRKHFSAIMFLISFCFCLITPHIPIAEASYPKKPFKTRAKSNAYWKPVVKSRLKKKHEFTNDNMRDILQIIWGESHGNPKAKNRNHIYYGLVQFGNSWAKGVARSQRGTSHDWRMNPIKSIDRLIKLEKIQGNKGLHRHWSVI